MVWEHIGEKSNQLTAHELACRVGGCVSLNGTLWALVTELHLVSTRLGDLHCTPFNHLKNSDIMDIRERKLSEIWGKHTHASLYLPPTAEFAGGHESETT